MTLTCVNVLLLCQWVSRHKVDTDERTGAAGIHSEVK